MQKFKNIILDYGNVIFLIDFLKAQQAFSDLGIKNVASIFGHRVQSKLFDDFDTGKIDESTFRNGIREIADAPNLTDEQIDSAWNALLLGVPDGNHTLLEALGKQYRLFLLSNNNAIHYKWIIEYLQREFGLTDNSVFFEKDYYSHLVGIRKPDPEIFQFVLHEQGLLPEETLFIDDSPQHLETAQQLGLHTALCTTDENLRVLISKLGLL